MGVPQQEKVLTALGGEFLVAGKLCLMGYNASLTLKNFPNVDIFAFNPKNNKTISIQVKTKKGGKEYFIPEKMGEMNIPFIFVNVNENNSIDYYIIHSKEAGRISEKAREEYTNKHPNLKKPLFMIAEKDIQKFKDRWDLLGLD